MVHLTMMWTTRTLLSALLVVLCSSSAIGWAPSSHLRRPRRSASKPLHVAVEDSSVTQQADASSYRPIFDFSETDTVSKFDRIDDVIMGGISSSTLIDVSGEPYGKWFGNCRIDGGGFCGMRTLPFENPLDVAGADGFYLDVRLASDSEPERRAWKMTTRVKPDRGEQLYQAMYEFSQDADSQEWSRVKVPFSSFKLVRGPRMVPGGPALNITGGLYQIGMTMSKFGIAENTTEIENFRPGFFELQIKQMGVYKEQKDTKLDDFETPKVLSKDEASRRRPLIVKLLLPISKLFFTEQSRRRKSAMNILREKRGKSRLGAILFGLKSRARSYGWVPSIVKTIGILTADSLRAAALTFLRLTLIYPIRLLRRTILFVSGKKPKASLSE